MSTTDVAPGTGRSPLRPTARHRRPDPAVSRWRPLWVTGTTRARAYAANRGALVVNTVMYFFVTAALSTVWRTAVGSAGGEMVGYSATAIVWYIATTEVCIMSLPPRVIEIESEAIASGAIEIELLQPIDLFAVRIARWMGHALPKVGIAVIIGVAWSWWFGGAPLDGVALLLAVPAILLAVFNNVVAQVGVGANAFWIRDIRGLWFLYQKLVFLLGGMLLPLEILPDGVQRVARLLPLMTMAYAPGRLAAGYREPELLAWQLGWTVALVLGSAWFFRRGLERMRRQP